MMPTGPDFRIYYDDQLTYTCDVWNAPGLGVLCIVEADPDHGRRLVMQGDYYIWRDLRWYAVDFIGMVDYLLQPGPCKGLVGRKVANDVFYAAVRAAEKDPDFPARTAWAAGKSSGYNYQMHGEILACSKVFGLLLQVLYEELSEKR